MRLSPTNTSLWLLSGIGLDFVTLVITWCLLDISGAHDALWQEYLDIIGLFVTPWLVHVVLLPALWKFPICLPSCLLALIAHSVAFLGIAAIGVPVIGISVGTLLLVPFGLVDGIVNGWGSGWNRTIAANFLVTDVYWTIAASVTGAAIGILLNTLRPFPARLRSDVVGAALAALLAFAGMFILKSLDLFNQPLMVSKLTFPPIAAPYLAAYVAIGILALLPHLILIRTNPGYPQLTYVK